MANNEMKSVRVLLVEDNPSDAIIISRSLKGAPGSGFDIVIADCLSGAKSNLHIEYFDLVLLDLSLPDSSGLSTLAEIISCAPQTPTVVLTGQSDDGIGMACIDAGAQDYMCKAVMTATSLRTTVNFALGRYREAQAKLMRMVVQGDSALSSSAAAVPVTRALAGLSPIRDRETVLYKSLTAEYQVILLQYMEHLSRKSEKPKPRMDVLATHFGDLGSTPRDIIDIHTFALGNIADAKDKTTSYQFAADSRLFALEMMGILVDYYRTGFRRLVAGGSKL